MYALNISLSGYKKNAKCRKKRKDWAAIRQRVPYSQVGLYSKSLDSEICICKNQLDFRICMCKASSWPATAGIEGQMTGCKGMKGIGLDTLACPSM